MSKKNIFGSIFIVVCAIVIFIVLWKQHDPATFFCAVATLFAVLFFWFSDKKQQAVNVCTTIGVFGTFWSLFDNIQNLDSINNIDANFIKSFASAFSTSLIGILSGTIVRIAVILSTPKLSDEKQAIEAKSERAYLYDILEQSKKSQTQLLEQGKILQNKILEALASQNNTFVIWQETNKRVFETMSEKMDKLALLETLETLAEDLAGIGNTFKNTATELVEKLNAQLAPIVKQVGETAIADMQKAITEAQKISNEQAKKSLDEVNDKLLSAIKTLAVKTDEQTQKMETFNTEQLGKIQTFYGTAQTEIQQTNNDLRSEIENLSVLQTKEIGNIQTVFSGLQQSIGTYQTNFQNNLIAQQATVQKQVDDWKLASEEATKAHQTQMETTEKQAKESAELQVQEFAKRLTNYSESLFQPINAKIKNVEEILTKVMEWQQTYKTHLENTSTLSNTAVNEFAKLTHQHTENNQAIADFSKNMNTLQADITTLISNLQTVTKASSSQQTQLNDLAAAITQMQSIQTLLNSLNGYFSKS